MNLIRGRIGEGFFLRIGDGKIEEEIMMNFGFIYGGERKWWKDFERVNLLEWWSGWKYLGGENFGGGVVVVIEDYESLVLEYEDMWKEGDEIIFWGSELGELVIELYVDDLRLGNLLYVGLDFLWIS